MHFTSDGSLHTIIWMAKRERRTWFHILDDVFGIGLSNREHSIWFHILDVIFNIAIIVAIVVGIRTFLVSPFQVEGKSMVDTLEHRQYIIINKLAYYLGSPERGDVVVFKPPNERKKYYVKRIIGLPGDDVIIRNGFVYVQPAGSDDEIKIEESYLNRRNAGHTYRNPPNSGNTKEIRYEVLEDHYFLLGDNRQGSLDSRSFMVDGKATPNVPEDNIKGKVWFIALPFNRIRTIDAPDFGF